VFYEEPMPYSEIVKRVGMAKMATLGLAPTFARNLIMLSVCKPIPNDVPGYGSIVVALSFGSVVLSHPFEVMRVHLQYSDKKSSIGDIRSAQLKIYGQDGVAGFFKGFAPRAVAMTPVMVTWMMY
jgi:hypothetical protein